MGALTHIRKNMNSREIKYISRPESASTAVGYKKIHDVQFAEILSKVFN